jgi:hypothetical protein
MNKEKNQLALPTALLVGFYTLFFLGGITRELMARFGGSLEVAACGLLFLMLWITIGWISLPVRQYPIAATVTAVAILPFTAIVGIVTVAILPAAGAAPGSGTVILIAGAGTFLFGLNSGISYALNNSNAKRNNYIGWITGAIAGGVSYQFCNNIPVPEIFLLFGSAALLLIAVFIKQFSHKVRGCFALASITVLLISGWLWQNQNYFQNKTWQTGPLTGSRLKSLEYPDGRYSLVAEPHRRQGEFILYKNGRRLWSIPADSGKYSASALFSAMQNMSSKRQRVLIISSPFTKVPYLMLGLPNIGSVDLLCRNRDFALLSAYCGILPPPSPHFKLITNHRGFFSSSWFTQAPIKKYDLIMIFDNTSEQLLTPYIFRQLKTMLNQGGVVTVGIRHQRKQAAKIADSLRTIFPEVKILNGNPLLIAAGNQGITISLSELDARFSANGNLPAGTLEVLYSTLQTTADKSETPAMFQTRIFVLPQLPWNFYLVAAIGFALYLTLRFFMSRRHNNSIIFTAGENGFYATAMIITTALYFQTSTGEIYSRGVLPIATIMSGIALGTLFFNRVSKIVAAITILSIILPAALLSLNLPFIEQWPIEFTITPLLVFAGIAIGCCHIMLRRKTTVIDYSQLPLFEFTGGIIAVILTLLHGMFEPDILSIILILIAIRLTTAISVIKTNRFTKYK